MWNNRKIDSAKLETDDEFELYRELKRLDGFDVQIAEGGGQNYYRSFYDAVRGLYETELRDCRSVYEVGCGSGANLMILKNRGLQVGGLDYSGQLVGVAQKIMPGCDIRMSEAIGLTDDRKYDAVISDSVFAYFPNEEYGREVLKKMYDKANSKIILLEIFDKAMEEECNAYRRASVENYDEKYAGLDKIFYPRSMFIDFAKEHGCEIKFMEVKNDYYWNSKYMYHCCLSKR